MSNSNVIFNNKNGIEVLKVKISENWLLGCIYGWNYRNTSRYKNWFAIITRNEAGEFQYQWLKESKMSDEYFNVHGVKVGDILVAGCRDKYKDRGCVKAFYKVLSLSTDSIELARETTYRKAQAITEETTIEQTQVSTNNLKENEKQ